MRARGSAPFFLSRKVVPMDRLQQDIQNLRGIGPARAKRMKKLGLSTVDDLIRFFPRDYEDRRTMKCAGDIGDGEKACAELTVSTQPRLSHIRKGLDLIKFKAVDETGIVFVTYFNQSWLKNSFAVGETYLFYGEFSRKGTRLEIVNPIFEERKDEGRSLLRIMPVYPLTAGINQTAMRQTVRQGLDACGDVFPEPVPSEIRSRYKLAAASYAFENVHFPADEEALRIARRKLVFEEFFTLACAQKMVRGRRNAASGYRIPRLAPEDFETSLPFELTGAQKRVIREAFDDMILEDHPMNRLVQGDVGSGKTVVAAACCWLASSAGLQSAVMAPTELLAEQHYRSFRSLLEPFGIRVEKLTGSLTQKEKNEIYRELEAGSIGMLVGTHALISEKVRFRNLAFCVVDEQHRFGVLQRAAFTKKGEEPHLLVMSATPIPRTLALIIYGDLDISVIDELPPGRKTVETYSVKEKMRPRIEAFARKLVGEGHQVYWVCPAVEENEEIPSLRSAEQTAEDLRTRAFPDLRVELLHGRMKAPEKDEVMRRFSTGEADILVSTTVVEVGVDVPNAVLMVVENADRFGLSQLHQLRGRVGRGSSSSYCVLFDAGDGNVSAERLSVMCRTNDGFQIAETDLKLRGPGDFLGSRQHGLPELKIADLAEDMDVLRMAGEAAQDVLKKDARLEDPEYEELKVRVARIIEGFRGGMN